MLIRPPYDLQALGIDRTGTANYSRFVQQPGGDLFDTATIVDVALATRNSTPATTRQTPKKKLTPRRERKSESYNNIEQHRCTYGDGAANPV